MQIFFIIFLVLSNTLFSVPLAYFTPPKGWDLVDPSKYSSTTLMGFVARSHEPFRASMNLGFEKIQVSEKEYLEAVEKRFKYERQHQWKSLGQVETKAGLAHLSQMHTKHGFGQTTSLQAILILGETAFVITALSLKEDFSSYFSAFLESIKSFSFLNSPIDHLSDKQIKLFEERKNSLLQAIRKTASKSPSSHAQKKHFVAFEKFLDKEYKSEGPGWKMMICNNIKETLQNN